MCERARFARAWRRLGRSGLAWWKLRVQRGGAFWSGASAAQCSVSAHEHGRVRMRAASSGARPSRVASSWMMQGPPRPARQTVKAVLASRPMAPSTARSSAERSEVAMTARSPLRSWFRGRRIGLGVWDTGARMVLRLSRNCNRRAKPPTPPSRNRTGRAGGTDCMGGTGGPQFAAIGRFASLIRGKGRLSC